MLGVSSSSFKRLERKKFVKLTMDADGPKMVHRDKLRWKVEAILDNLGWRLDRLN